MSNDLFLDPVNGSDSNTGADWAHPIQTFSGATTGNGLAAGRTVRLCKSPAPVDTGYTAAFVDQQAYCTIQGGVYPFQNITLCDSNWTAVATGVSCATDGTNKKQGTSACKTTLAASPGTNALQSYFATGTLNLSGYWQITGWIRVGTALTSANNLVLALCSDTAGATPVNSFAIPQYAATNTWIQFTINNGSALGGAIKSVALYTGSAAPPASLVVTLDCLVACLNPASAGAITLKTLVSKNSAEQSDPYSDGYNRQWYGISYLDSSTGQIGIDGAASQNISTKGFSGTSETVELYRREPLPLPLTWTTALGTLPLIGSTTAASPVTISGGWDTGTGLQTGETFIDCQPVSSQIFLYLAGGQNYCTISRINAWRSNCSPNGAIAFSNTQNAGCAIQYCRLGGNYYGIAPAGLASALVIKNCSFVGNWSGPYGNTYAAMSFQNCIFASNTNGGSQTSASPGKYTNCVFYNNSVGLFQQYNSGICYNCTFAKNYSHTRTDLSASVQILASCTVGTSTIGTANMTTAINQYSGARVYSDPEGVVYGDCSTWTQTTLAGFSGHVLQCACTSANLSSTYGADLVVMPVECVANVAVTITASAQRTNTGITSTLLVAGGQIAGVPNDVNVSQNAAANTKETLTLTFTPTANGTIDLTWRCYGGTTYSAYLGEINNTPLPANALTLAQQFGLFHAGAPMARMRIASPRSYTS